MRPWALDLCCGGGGFSAGLHAAGFDVVGVDIAPQPDYPFRFIQADALTVDLSGFALIAGSPPCQRWSQVTPADRRGLRPDILTPLRERLSRLDVPWVLENVPGAPMRDPIRLCGDTLRLGVRRHRLFESNRPLRGTPCLHDRGAPSVGVYGTHGGPDGSVTADAGREAMGSPWMPWPALAQSIPPIYGLWIGMQMWPHVGAAPWPGPPLVRDASRPASMGHGPDAGVTDERRARDGSTPGAPVTPSAVEPSRPACRHCGVRPVSRPATGRWGRYCSHACRQAAYRVREAAEGRIR